MLMTLIIRFATIIMTPKLLCADQQPNNHRTTYDSSNNSNNYNKCTTITAKHSAQFKYEVDEESPAKWNDRLTGALLLHYNKNICLYVWRSASVIAAAHCGTRAARRCEITNIGSGGGYD